MPALLPPARPRAYTVHYPLPDGRAGVAGERALLRRMDAVFIHTESGASVLRDRIGVDPGRVHVVPHGAFDYLTRLPEEAPLPADLAAVEGPVVLCFGLLRPYKGIDVLLEAFREIEGAELWIVGMPRMPVEPLRELAARCRATLRLRSTASSPTPRSRRSSAGPTWSSSRIARSSSPASSTRPSRSARRSSPPTSGASPTSVPSGGARLVPPGDPAALGEALAELIADDEARAALASRAAELAATDYSWDSIAERTLAVYRELLA